MESNASRTPQRPLLGLGALGVDRDLCRLSFEFELLHPLQAALRVLQRERAKRAVRLLDLEGDLGPVDDAFFDLPLPRGLGADRAGT
jgi:hypothetical protein